MDFIEKYMLDTIRHQQEIQQLLNEKKLQTQEVKSNIVQALKVDSIVMENTCSGKQNSNYDCIQQISKRKQLEFCNKRFLSKEDLKGTRIEHGFKRAFMSLFGQDADTFTSTMLINVDRLQKQLDKDEFQEDGSIEAFWVRYTTPTHRSGNDTDADDVDIKPIYNEELMAETQLTAECGERAWGDGSSQDVSTSLDGALGGTTDGWYNSGALTSTLHSILHDEHQSDTQVITMKMEIMLEPTSNKLMVDAQVMRTASAAGKPCQGDYLEFYLITGSTPDDCIKVKEFQRSFRHSDTERLSRSDEVLKLNNFKKDATLKVFKSTNQERYEHVGPEVTSSQDDKVYKMAKRDYA
ncbi:hypothetical protein Tco_0455734 [Tanacetum coccineum]